MDQEVYMSKWINSTDANCRINPQGKENISNPKRATTPQKTHVTKQKPNLIVEVKNNYNLFLPKLVWNLCLYDSTIREYPNKNHPNFRIHKADLHKSQFL